MSRDKLATREAIEFQSHSENRKQIAVALVFVISLISACTAAADDEATTTEVETPTTDSTQPTATTADEGGEHDPDVVEAYEAYARDAMPGVSIDLIQAAKDEGVVVHYTGASGDATVNAFTEHFPFIDLELIQLTAGPLAERFASEKAAGVDEVDLYTAPEPGFLPFVDEGWCESYTPTSDEAYADSDKIPGTAYRWGGAYFGIVFVPPRLDPSQIATFNSWEAFGADENAGLVWGVVDAPPGGASFFTWTGLYSVYGEELWEEHVEKASAVNLYGGGRPTTSALVLGEIDVAAAISLSGAVGMWEAGAPVGWTTPTPLAVAPWMGCIASNPPHPNAARLLWEFILSDEGQLTIVPIFHSYKGGLDLSQGLPESLLEEEWYTPPDTSSVIRLTVEEAAALEEEVNTAWRRIYAGEG